jgi:hypothetical protein
LTLTGRLVWGSDISGPTPSNCEYKEVVNQNICCPSALLEARGFPPFFLSTTTMSPKDTGTTIVDQTPFVVPEISIKELLDAIPYIYYFFSPNQQFMLFLVHTASSVLPYGPLSTCKPKLSTTKARFFTSS